MHRNVKILATLGPSSSQKEEIRQLFDAGANAFRLNMSHGTHQEASKRFQAIREIERESGEPISILADLQGPKLRVAEFQDGQVSLSKGDQFQLDLDPTPGDRTRVCLPHPEILEVLEPGATLLIDDGKLRLHVEEVLENRVVTTVVVGGTISNRKGVNVPDVILPIAALTEKDRRDLEFACELGVDWIALSFVQRAEDIAEAKALCRDRAAIIAKIEKPSAVAEFEAIVEQADGIMVARGDLGVEIPLSQVPVIQKELITRSRKAGKPVIIATQMLESMITAPVPTRAEVSDVACAIYDGVDAVMLSAESAAGAYPVEAVSTMDEVAKRVEADGRYKTGLEASRAIAGPTMSDAIAEAVRQVAETLQVQAICTFTQTGRTALRVARERPRVPIMVLTPDVAVARRLALGWGLICKTSGEVESFTDAVETAKSMSFQNALSQSGGLIAVTGGVPFNVEGSTNSLRIASVP